MMMEQQLEAFRKHVREVAANPGFAHHSWFAKWHLEIVERLALELCEHYPQADRHLVSVLAWMHDYGEMVDEDNEYMMTTIGGREALAEAGFPSEFVAKAVTIIESMSNKRHQLDLRQAVLEVQIISSADGCARMTGPYLYMTWNQNADMTDVGKTTEELMSLGRDRLRDAWENKVILPEARQAYQLVYEVHMGINGSFPDKFFS